MQRVGEPVDQLRRDILDHADAAAVLRDRARELQVGSDLDRRRAVLGRDQAEIDIGVGAAPTLGIPSLSLDAGGVAFVVAVLEAGVAREGERHRPEPDRYLALEAVLVDHLGELGPRHAGGDPLDVGQDCPGLVDRYPDVE